MPLVCAVVSLLLFWLIRSWNVPFEGASIYGVYFRLEYAAMRIHWFKVRFPWTTLLDALTELDSPSQ